MTLYLVTGPPAAGKSTWVREHAQHGDITIDYDTLAATLTPPGGKPHDWPPAVKAVTKAARQAAIDTAIQHATTTDVYVIHSNPSQRLIDHYANVGAQVVTIDPGRATVLARAKKERPWRIQQAAKEWYTDQTRCGTTPSDPATPTKPGVAQHHPGRQTGVDATRDW